VNIHSERTIPLLVLKAQICTKNIKEQHKTQTVSYSKTQTKDRKMGASVFQD
jgi:hypothetical protein